MSGATMPGGAPSHMPFIVLSSVDKPDPATRKFIRSHVMRGRRNKKGRPGRGPGPRSKVSDSDVLAYKDHTKQVKMGDMVEAYNSLMPPRIGSDVSLVELADEVEPEILINIAKIADIASRVIFPLKGAIGFKVDTREWMSNLVGPDPAALHITVFAMEGFIDKVLCRQMEGINRGAMLHFQKGLKLLRARLLWGDDESKVSDSTIGVVVKLANASHFGGDSEAAKHHMDGLRKMTDLRGGLDGLRGKLPLIEILRCDLGIAMLNGFAPVFYRQPEEPFPDFPQQLLSADGDKMTFQDNLDLIRNMHSGLATVWRALRRFCSLINLGTQIQRYMRQELIHDSMMAVMYRLLYMSYNFGSLDEAIRLGLLAFSHHLFLQWQDIKLPYQYFPRLYQRSILALKKVEGICPELVLWLLMTGANSVFYIIYEPWLIDNLRECSKRCKITSWKEMEAVLKSIMWISLLDEESGKQVYDYINQGEKQGNDIV